MFQGCFTYEKKEPCYYQTPKIKQEKEEAVRKINKLNKELEPLIREKWELKRGIERLSLRIKPSKKP